MTKKEIKYNKLLHIYCLTLDRIDVFFKLIENILTSIIAA